MSSTVIEVSLSDLEEGEDERIEQIVDTLANDVVPSLAEAADVEGSAIASRMLLEFAYVVGFTHSAIDAMDVMVSVGQAIQAGQADAADVRKDQEHSDSDATKGDLALRPASSRRTH
jgi:hypothetical protein